jgi:hypothetical protein
MLVRALKLLDYFEIETVGMVAATAALIQPGDEGRAYDRGTAERQRLQLLNFSSPRRDFARGTPRQPLLPRDPR